MFNLSPPLEDEVTKPLNYHEQRNTLKKKYFKLPDIPQNLINTSFNVLKSSDFDQMSIDTWLRYNGHNELRNHVMAVKNRRGEDVLTWKKMARVKSNQNRNIPVTVKGLFYPNFAEFKIDSNDRLLDLIHLIEKYTGFYNTQIRVLNAPVAFVIWDSKKMNEEILQLTLLEMIGEFDRLDLFISLVY